MNKNIVKILGMVILMLMPFVYSGSDEAAAQVNVGINLNIGPPPAYVVPAPPPVVVVPGTYVYYAPGLSVDILFYHGHWYRPHGGYWYVATSYNGPWAYLPPANVPHAIVALPPHYRTIPPGQTRIPYGQLKKNWAYWETSHHWEGNREWQEGAHRGGPGGHGQPEGQGGPPQGKGKGQGKGHGKGKG